MITLVYKSDKGCRKGCHPVYILQAHRGEIEESHYFSVDEPGAWWDTKWNCHVDGCDYPCESKKDAIDRGAAFWGYDSYKLYYEE